MDDPRKPRSPAFSISSRFAQPDLSAYVPGPGTHAGAAPPAVGRQRVSSRRSQPSYSFGGGLSRTSPLRGNGMPGPGTYAAPSGFGGQAVSQRPSSPAVRIRSRIAELKGAMKSNAAPGSYDAEDSVGRQRASSRKSQPAFSFGQEGRLRPTSAGGAPGPGKYRLHSSLGRQADSRFRSAGAFSIGAKRAGGLLNPAYSSAGPALCREDSAFGPQRTSTRRTHGAITMSGRTSDSFATRPVVEIYRRLATPSRR